LVSEFVRGRIAVAKSVGRLPEFVGSRKLSSLAPRSLNHRHLDSGSITDLAGEPSR